MVAAPQQRVKKAAVVEEPTHIIIPLATLKGLSEKRRSELAGWLPKSRPASEPPTVRLPVRPGPGNERCLEASPASARGHAAARHQAHRSSVSDHGSQDPQMAAPLSAARFARAHRTLVRPASPDRIDDSPAFTM